jgi:uncharacterized protein YndB with AHSA1/START domain
MTNENSYTDAQSEREIVIIRIFNAPRNLVFKVWTEAQHITQWWGPKGFTTTVKEMDFRPGGNWHYVMHGPDGTEYPAKGSFREIVQLEKIVTTDEFEEGFDQVVKADLPSGPMVVTSLFEDLGNKTRLTLRILHSTAEDRHKHEKMGVIGGWNSSFDCLEEHLAKLVETH